MKKRIAYILITLLLFLTEVVIAVFKFNPFIRNTFGDILVVILIWTFLNIFFVEKVRYLSIYVFIFACFTEFMQYLKIVELLGVQDNKLLCTLIGTTFSWSDIIAYAIGCAVVLGYEVYDKSKQLKNGKL